MDLFLKAWLLFYWRWRIVVHGGIDGYSRLPVYLHAAINNKAATVLELFQEAVSVYGLPSRVRCDKGGENYDVGWFMLHPEESGGNLLSNSWWIEEPSITRFKEAGPNPALESAVQHQEKKETCHHGDSLGKKTWWYM